MNQYKLQFLLLSLIMPFLFGDTSLQAQTDVFQNNILAKKSIIANRSLFAKGGSLFLSNRGTGGPRVYGAGVTWTGIIDQAAKWTFLSRKNDYTSIRSNSAMIKVNTAGRVDLVGTPVQLTYLAYAPPPDPDFQDSNTMKKSNTPYTALIPQYTNRAFIGTYNKLFHSVYTNRLLSTHNYVLSDKNVKKDINKIQNSLEKVLSLQGYSYKFNGDHPFITEEELAENKINLGFMAQELQKVFPEMVVKHENTGHLMVENYEQLFPVIVEAMKEQQTQINKKDELILDLASRLEKLEDLAESTQVVMEDFSLEVTLSGSKQAILDQNHPNPFKSLTTINFFIPQDSGLANIKIFDQNGRVWKSIPVTEKGHGNLKVHTTEMPSGTFVYQLEVDGKIIDSKKMVVAN